MASSTPVQHSHLDDSLSYSKPESTATTESPFEEGFDKRQLFLPPPKLCFVVFMNSYNVSGTGCVCSFVGLRLRSLQEAQGYAVWMLRAHENWGWWVLCDYDWFLRGQQRANDDGCCSFGMLMTMTVRWRRRTTPGRVRIATVAIVGFKAARTLQTHQIPVHLNTLINCTAPENKKNRQRKQDGNTMISIFL